MALDIVFFGDDMELVDSLSMVPCSPDSCPSYVPDAPFSWALETPAGSSDLWQGNDAVGRGVNRRFDIKFGA